MKILYQACDGVIFENKWDCEDYETTLKHPNLKNIDFFIENSFINLNCTFGTLIKDLYEQLDNIYEHSWKINIHNNEEFNDFLWLINYCGWCEFEDITEPGVWKRYEDKLHNGYWEKISE